MPQGLGPAMHGIVFRRRDHPQVLGIVALHAGYVGDPHPSCKVGVLAIGLLAAPPARIAEDVQIRRPEIQPHADEVSMANLLVVLGAGLGSDRRRQVLNQGRIEACPQPDRLGKYRCRSLRHAMQRLAPPVIGRDLESRYGRCDMHHLGGFFLEGHAADQVIDALI